MAEMMLVSVSLEAFSEIVVPFTVNEPVLTDENCDVFRSEEHTSELQSHLNLVCRLLLEKKNNTRTHIVITATPVLSPSICLLQSSTTTDLHTLSLHDALPI